MAHIIVPEAEATLDKGFQILNKGLIEYLTGNHKTGFEAKPQKIGIQK